ncbi:MAG: oligosaccharide flippase family protein [Chitinispirillaceae bacterium]|nr:oligosaccharide flippase family protein [Chitinispirillaceae bacterium]
MQTRVRYNVAWSMTAIIAKNGCLIVTYMLLARLLDPAAFGCIAITMVAMGLAYSFVDSGFTSVVVRQKTFDRDVFSSLYWFNITVGTAAAALLVAAGWLAAQFFSEERFVRLMATAGIALWCAAWGHQFIAVLQRHGAFKEIAAVEAGAAFLALVTAVSRALAGAGPAAYFEGLIVGHSAAALMAFSFGRRHFIPGLRFSRGDLRTLLSFGFFNTAERCINYIAFNLEKPLLGRVFSMELLGLYTVVNQLVTRPVMLFSGAFSRVAYPMYANLQTKSAALNVLYIKYTGKLALMVVPIYGFLALFGDTVIPLLFGQRFAAANVYVMPLCLLGAIWSIGNPFGSYLMALNRAKIGFLYNTGAALLTMAVFLIGSRYSLVTMLWLWVGAVMAVMVPIEWIIRYRLTGMSGWKYAASFLPPAIAAAVAAGAIFLVRSVLEYERPFPVTLIEMGLYCSLYAVYGLCRYRRDRYSGEG